MQKIAAQTVSVNVTDFAQNETFNAGNVSVKTQNGTTVSAPKRTATVLLEQLVAEKEAWFNNAYRTSNDQLYALLAKCYDFYFQLKESENGKKLREGFDEHINAKGYTFSSGSHTLVKIVKCVFGADRRRVSAYGIVLRTALQKNLPSDQVAAFIAESGGVEEIRLARAPNAMTGKQKAEVSAQCLNSRVLTVVKSLALEQMLDAGNIGKPVVLVGTWQSDGSIAVHACTNASGAVNAALISQYAATKAEDNKKKADAVAANDSSVSADVIAKAAEEAMQGQQDLAA